MKTIIKTALVASIIYSFFHSPVDADEQNAKDDDRAKIIFHLPFDENLNAKTQTGNGMPIKNQTNAHFVPGKKGKALILWDPNGWSLAYEIKNNLNSSSGTIAFWIMPLEKKDEKHHLLFSTGKSKDQNLMYISYSSPTKTKGGKFIAIFSVKRLRPVRFQISSWGYKAENKWKKAEWHHVMLVWDELRGVALFFDGQPVTGPPTNNGPFVFLKSAFQMRLGPALVAIDDFLILDRPVNPADFAILTKTSFSKPPSKAIEYKYTEAR